MYRIIKVLSHNAVIVVSSDNHQKFLILGKGIGFGRKIAETISTNAGDTVYSLTQTSNRGSAEELVKSVSTEYLEIADVILNKAEQQFGKIDRNILFPMADHIAFAVKRMENNEVIKNPLTEDIKLLFNMEYKIAEEIRPLLKEKKNLIINDHEIGYIALHVHSAIEDDNVSQAMQIAWAARECVSIVEQQTGKVLESSSLSYNRLMNHVRFLIIRSIKKETLKINMNDYMKVRFPQSYAMAEKVCEKLAKNLKFPIEDVEIGYLAMHIERVISDGLAS